MWNALATLLEVPLGAAPESREAREAREAVEIAVTPPARDAIVVLGAALGPGDSLSRALAERVRAAAHLYHAGGAPLVIATGGRTRTSRRAEADVMAEALAALGVPNVLVERRARSTKENARLASPMLLERGARTAWLVTQPFHEARARRMFEYEGIDVQAWRIADSVEYADRRRAVRWLVREYAAWARMISSR